MDSNKIKKGLGRGLSSLIGESQVKVSTNKLLISDLQSNKFQPRTTFNEEDLYYHKNDTFRELVKCWENLGLCEISYQKTNHVWLNKIGDILLYDRPVLDWLEKDLNLEHLTKMTQVISLDEVDQVAKNMLENKTFGRIVVDVNL